MAIFYSENHKNHTKQRLIYYFYRPDQGAGAGAAPVYIRGDLLRFKIKYKYCTVTTTLYLIALVEGLYYVQCNYVVK